MKKEKEKRLNNFFLAIRKSIYMVHVVLLFTM